MPKKTVQHSTESTSININQNKKLAHLSNEYGPCSCCLELWSLKSLWAEYNWMGHTEVYGQMLNDCFNLHWVPEASADRICEVCVSQLRIAAAFRRQLVSNRAKLKKVDIKKETRETESELQSYDIKTETNSDGTIQYSHEDSPQQEYDLRRTVPPKKKVKRIRANVSKQSKTNYMTARHDACLLLGHSTIMPFKSNQGYFNCFYCNKQFVEFQELKSHVTDNHANLDLKSISKSIQRPKDRIRADVGNMACKLCNTDIPNLHMLVEHLTDKHGLKFNKSKPTECLVPYRLNDGKFVCHECGGEFLFFKTLSKHMNEHSTDYVCAVCGRCFLLPERLRAHAQMHDTVESIQCEFCTKVFTTKMQLKSHIRYTHKKISFKCSICDETFSTYRSRLEHLVKIHNRTPFNLNCKICSKKFKTPNSLNSHVRSEHMKMVKECKFECAECGMRFKYRHALANHSTVHSGVKNFECDICHKKYARSKTLVEHLKIHYNDKRWSCSACMQSFVQKCSLKNHIRVHHVDCDMEQLIVYKKSDK